MTWLSERAAKIPAVRFSNREAVLVRRFRGRAFATRWAEQLGAFGDGRIELPAASLVVSAS